MSILVLGLAFVAAAAARGADDAAARDQSPTILAAEKAPIAMREILGRELPRARVEIEPGYRGIEGTLPENADFVRILQDNRRGDAQFLLRGTDAEGRGVEATAWVRYRAHQPGWVALKRILPGEALSAEALARREIDVTEGLARQSQGLLLPPDAEIAGLEARQTVLEGGFVLASAVRRLPDVRRGDVVRIRLISGDVTLSTVGTAEEPGYLDGQLRVITTRTKKNLIGRLKGDKTVEVRL